MSFYFYLFIMLAKFKQLVALWEIVEQNGNTKKHRWGFFSREARTVRGERGNGRETYLRVLRMCVPVYNECVL